MQKRTVGQSETGEGMTTFTARNGKRYRFTGKFRNAGFREAHVNSAYSPLEILEGDALVNTSEARTDTPRIIVTPVEPEYDVTVRLSEEQFVRYQTTGRMFIEDHVGETVALIGQAIKAGKFTEVTS